MRRGTVRHWLTRDAYGGTLPEWDRKARLVTLFGYYGNPRLDLLVACQYAALQVAEVEDALLQEIVYLTRYGRIDYNAVMEMELSEVGKLMSAVNYWFRIENTPPDPEPTVTDAPAG